MEKKEEINKSDIIDEKLILPSFITKEYLEEKFNSVKEEQKEELNNDFNHNKIIIENKKLTIFEVDKENNLENKIYESGDFTEEIKKLKKIEDNEYKFDINLVKNLKNGIFIIESKNMVYKGAFFFIKYNKTNKEMEIISEEKNRQIEFIMEYSDGNFAYRSYIHGPMLTEDTFYVFNINKKEKYKLISLEDYDGVDYSSFASLTNGFAFNNYFCFNGKDKANYLNIVEGFNLKRYVINFVGHVRRLISDDKYIYLLSYKEDNSVYIFNIECKKFYSKFFEIKLEPEKIEDNEHEIEIQIEKENSNEENLEVNKNSNEQNLEENKNFNEQDLKENKNFKEQNLEEKKNSNEQNLKDNKNSNEQNLKKEKEISNEQNLKEKKNSNKQNLKEKKNSNKKKKRCIIF